MAFQAAIQSEGRTEEQALPPGQDADRAEAGAQEGGQDGGQGGDRDTKIGSHEEGRPLAFGAAVGRAGLDGLVLFLRWFGRGGRLGRSRLFSGRLWFVCEKRKQSQGREKVENGSHAPLLWTSSPRLW